ncbi:hypothetical protein [Pseudomonas putida]|uniref:hypothetical protein n=1 Tax=Pseudomonas putida TaxID=303 RepID=UPI00383B0B76
MIWGSQKKPIGIGARRVSSSRDFYLPLLVCALSAAGSWAGVTLTAQYTESSYRYQKVVEWESKIFERRVDTVERMARLIARQPGIKDEWSRYLKAGEIPPRESSQRLEEYNAEYVNVLILANLYFGDETRAAVAALEKTDSPWWMKTLDSQSAVTEAMTKELSSMLPTLGSALDPGAK